ncbi:MAG: MBL fold metallo-hydrolase [Acidiferrobacterales bacterium]
MQLRFLGSGDAFGSGGRFNTCMLVTTSATAFLIDCGASSLIAMRHFNVDPNTIDTILISHLHGDHFGGLPFMILDAQLVSKRTQPLTVAGPPGMQKRLVTAMECFFPGSSGIQRKFEVRVLELQPEVPSQLNGIAVTPYVVQHYSGAPPFALRIQCEGKVIAYSGDTEWTENLVSAAHEADLFIAEAYFFEKQVKYHLNFRTLQKHLNKVRPKRLILTHMSQDMLGRLEDIDYETAEDGKIIEI